MKGTILLDCQESIGLVEQEEKNRFLKTILEQIGLPIHEFWEPHDKYLSVHRRMKLRGILTTYGIVVLDDKDGAMDIYVEGEIIAQWKKPHYKLKKDLSQIDRHKQLYLEMSVEYWSLFEENENNSDNS